MQRTTKIRQTIKLIDKKLQLELLIIHKMVELKKLLEIELRKNS